MRVFTAAGENIPAALKKEAATENPFAFCMVDILNMGEKTLRLAQENRGTRSLSHLCQWFFSHLQETTRRRKRSPIYGGRIQRLSAHAAPSEKACSHVKTPDEFSRRKGNQQAKTNPKI